MLICYAAKCNNIDAKCNKMFNAKCNIRAIYTRKNKTRLIFSRINGPNISTQIVITFLTHNVITQNVIICESRGACYFKIGIVAQSSIANPDLHLNYYYYHYQY